MIMTRNVNKISILMGLIIMKVNKKFQSNRLLRIFGISKSISGHLVITRATGDDNMNDRCK